MAFPSGPTNGQTTTVNGIAYAYNSAIGSWTRLAQPVGNLTVSGNVTVGGNLYITNTGDVSANIGAFQTYANANAATQATTINAIDANVGAFQIFSNANAATQATSINTTNANIGTFYAYANTKIGTNTNGNLVVVATTVSTDATTGALVVRGGAGIGGDMYIAGNIIPAANVTYDLGSSTTWFRDLWLSAGTIHIGGAKITQDPASGAIAIVPKATASNPNPKATVFSATGAVITANTAAGVISSETIATAAASTDFNVIGNLTANTATIAGNVVANTVYTTTGIRWAGNGVAFSSGGAGITYTANTAPPSSGNVTGDQWYNTTTNVLYEYLNDGTSKYWVDIQSPSITTNSSSSYGNTQVAAYLVANPQGSTYSNTNVEAYLGANLGSATTNITTLFSNAATQATSINTINANLGTATTNINTTNANLGAFQTYANVTFNYGNTQVTSYLTSNVSGVASTTGAINVPVGTTAQRPTTTSNGAIRYNTTLGRIEGYMYSGGWQNILSDTYAIDYLVVAGGGAGAGGQGGEGSGGGGGAGGYLTGTSVTVIPGTPYPITIGSGGTGVANDAGSAGGDSTGFGVTAVGGGRGSQGNAASSQTASNTMGGGSGGGSGFFGSTFGAGTSGQGNSGGNSGGGAGAGGGGGAGAAGTGGTSGTAGAGGVGLAWLNGTYYAGGGGGGLHQSSPSGGGGGNGGGGNGGSNSSGNGNNGTANTGGGGGGGGENPSSSSVGGSGGSGVVIVRYLGTQRGTGGTYSYTGGYSYHTFTGSGSFIP